ncbi:MAG: hypothetical protein JWL90_1565 [Chthoniobacteraceae bacterium]|nr:hypothetical protein [Chthoniobacteraceae bacterium]
MDQFPPKKPLSQRLQEKLAASRFFTFSFLIHVVIIAMGFKVVLFHQSRAKVDFTAEGGVVGADTAVAPQVDQLPDPTVQTFTPETPSVSAPTISAITSTNTTSASFQMASVPVPVVKAMGDVKLSELPKAMNSVPGKGLPSTMAGRMGGTARTMMMDKNKGKDSSEKAVMAGLRWLKQHQSEDGSWSPEFTPSMTGFAILCFLGHGETPESPEFGPTVKKGLDWLLQRGGEFQGRMSLTKDGWGGNDGVYQHAIATYAMGEYYTMTKDDRYAELLKQAVKYIVDGQAPDGGWNYGYRKEPNSDTSVAGWQIQALKAAHLSGLNIAGVDEALDKAMVNLKRVQGKNGGFGYRTPEDRYSLTGVGVLCTYFWKQDKDKVVREGIEFMLKETDEKYPVKYNGKDANLYAWYYNTQACLMYGGSTWSKWNRLFQDEIATSQSKDGSWPRTGAKDNPGGLELKNDGAGPFYRTSLCVLMLEVFYRYMPTTK